MNIFAEGYVECFFNAREKTHKWYFGLPKHIQLTFAILNILCIGIIMNSYILLVLLYSLLAIPHFLVAVPY